LLREKYVQAGRLRYGFVALRATGRRDAGGTSFNSAFCIFRFEFIFIA